MQESQAAMHWIEFWLAVAGVVIGVAAWIIPKEQLLGFVGSYWRDLVAATLALCLLGSVLVIPARWFEGIEVILASCIYIGLRLVQNELRKKQVSSGRLEEQIKELREARDTAIAKCNRLDYPKQSKSRWEALEQIEYGHLDYHPFLTNRGTHPSGIGLDLLTRLLNPPNGRTVTLAAHKYESKWSNVLSKLEEGHYDVVATPLFATFMRSKQARFTSPLFFSNVGLYVSRQTANEPEWLGMTVDNMRSRIERAGNLTFLSIKGEISETLAERYARDGFVSAQGEEGEKVVIDSLFDIVADTQNSRSAVFCESFYGHNHHKVKSGEVVNVLGLSQILYPVCFAVRLGDYHLADLLNIRLLEITKSDNALDLLAKALATESGSNMKTDEVKLHYVDEWPRKAPAPGGIHA